MTRGVLLHGLTLLFWMAVIFFFSSLSGNENQFEPTLLYYLERKGAHVIEYAVLMLFAVRFAYALFPFESLKKILFWTAVFSIIYSVSDEVHQIFVPYRGARISDVFIDASGILLAGGFIFLVLRYKKKLPII